MVWTYHDYSGEVLKQRLVHFKIFGSQWDFGAAGWRK
jgi:hypothetical protein